MNTGPSARERLTFLVIGVAILLFIDQIMLRGTRPYLQSFRGTIPDAGEMLPENNKDDIPEEIPQMPEEELPMPPPPPFEDYSEEFDAPAPEDEDIDSQEGLVHDIGFSEVEDLKSSIQSIDFSSPQSPAPFIRFIPSRPDDIAQPLVWQKNAVKVQVPQGMAKVAIVLDDMGVNEQMSDAAIDLQGPLTLAFLPYAKSGRKLSRKASSRGHELMVHMPMEPLNSKLDAGPDALTTALSKEAFLKILKDNLAAYENYVGINNHMGSKLTQNPEAMALVMEELRARGLLFVDSVTIDSSVAGKTAAAFGIANVSRDVFLDHDSSYESVMASLRRVEKVAHQKGVAVAIGHPKRNTIMALYEWLPTLQEKGIVLVPVSSVVITPMMNGAVVNASSPTPLPRPE